MTGLSRARGNCVIIHILDKPLRYPRYRRGCSQILETGSRFTSSSWLGAQHVFIHYWHLAWLRRLLSIAMTSVTPMSRWLTTSLCFNDLARVAFRVFIHDWRLPLSVLQSFLLSLRDLLWGGHFRWCHNDWQPKTDWSLDSIPDTINIMPERGNSLFILSLCCAREEIVIRFTFICIFFFGWGLPHNFIQ